MEKILLIGKFNVVFQEINNYLGSFYDVKICVDNYSMVKSMLEQEKPKAVVISMACLDRAAFTIFNELKDKYFMIPVLCIGTDSAREEYKEYLSYNSFSFLERPVSNEKIVKELDRLIREGVLTTENIMKKREEQKLRKTILVVDDNAIQLRALNDMLKTKYDVMMATSGMKALTMLGKRIPDVIFLDYEMPMCDGKMTLEMIRQIDEAKNVPVVFFTGVKDKAHIEAVLALKPAGYLLKPASAEMIYGTLDKIIG